MKKSSIKKGITRVKNRRALVDQDYTHKLSKSDLKFLEKFNEEYIGASFSKENGEYSSKNLHKTQELRRDSYNRNNRRNRCILTKAETDSTVVDIQEISYDKNIDTSLMTQYFEKINKNKQYEDILVEEIDKKDQEKASKELSQHLKALDKMAKEYKKKS